MNVKKTPVHRYHTNSTLRKLAKVLIDIIGYITKVWTIVRHSCYRHVAPLEQQTSEKNVFCDHDYQTRSQRLMEPTLSSLLFHGGTFEGGSALGTHGLTTFLTETPNHVNHNLPSKKNGGK